MTAFANAEVYWLKNILHSSSSKAIYSKNAVQNYVAELLEFDVLFQEDMIVNGAKGKLEVGLLDHTYFDFLYELNRYDFDDIVSTNVNTVIKFGNVRYLVYNCGDNNKALCFAFRVGEAEVPLSLPQGIPCPDGAFHDRIIEFPDRGTTYVSFSMIGNAEAAMADCSAYFSTEGLRNVGSIDGGVSGFFMTADGADIVMMSFDDEHKTGFIYRKKKKK